MADSPMQDPLEFMKSMWSSMGFSIPGMVTPTLDIGELDKRITDLKAVEGWLRVNLNMLQMSIQGLEMQRTTLAAMKALSQAGGAQQQSQGASFANSALWPWNFLQQATNPSSSQQPQQPAQSSETKANKPGNTSGTK